MKSWRTLLVNGIGLAAGVFGASSVNAFIDPATGLILWSLVNLVLRLITTGPSGLSGVLGR